MCQGGGILLELEETTKDDPLNVKDRAVDDGDRGNSVLLYPGGDASREPGN